MADEGHVPFSVRLKKKLFDKSRSESKIDRQTRGGLSPPVSPPSSPPHSPSASPPNSPPGSPRTPRFQLDPRPGSPVTSTSTSPPPRSSLVASSSSSTKRRSKHSPATSSGEDEPRYRISTSPSAPALIDRHVDSPSQQTTSSNNIGLNFFKRKNSHKTTITSELFEVASMQIDMLPPGVPPPPHSSPPMISTSPPSPPPPSTAFWDTFNFHLIDSASPNVPPPPPRRRLSSTSPLNTPVLSQRSSPTATSSSGSSSPTPSGRERAFAVDLSTSSSASNLTERSSDLSLDHLAIATAEALPARNSHRRSHSSSSSFSAEDLTDLLDVRESAKELRSAGCTIARLSTMFSLPPLLHYQERLKQSQLQTPSPSPPASPSGGGGPKGFLEFTGLPLSPSSSSSSLQSPSPSISPARLSHSPPPVVLLYPVATSSTSAPSVSSSSTSPSLSVTSPSSSPVLSSPHPDSLNSSSTPTLTSASLLSSPVAPERLSSSSPITSVEHRSTYSEPSQSQLPTTPPKRKLSNPARKFSHRSYIIPPTTAPRRDSFRRAASMLETLDQSVEGFFTQQVEAAKNIADIQLQVVQAEILSCSPDEHRQMLLDQIAGLLTTTVAQWCDGTTLNKLMTAVQHLLWEMPKSSAERAWSTRILMSASSISHAAMYFTLDMPKVDALVFMKRSIKAFRRQRECDLAFVREIEGPEEDEEEPPSVSSVASSSAGSTPSVVDTSSSSTDQEGELVRTVSKWQQSSSQPRTQMRNRVTLCRMCENNIQKNRFQQHLKECLEYTQVQTQIHFIDETLNRILLSLKQSTVSFSPAVISSPAASSSSSAAAAAATAATAVASMPSSPPSSPGRSRGSPNPRDSAARESRSPVHHSRVRKLSSNSPTPVSSPRAARPASIPNPLDDNINPLRQLIVRVLGTYSSISDDQWQICGTSLRLLVEVISRIRASGRTCDVFLAAASLIRKKQSMLKEQKDRLIHLAKDLSGFGFHRNRLDEASGVPLVSLEAASKRAITRLRTNAVFSAKQQSSDAASSSAASSSSSSKQKKSLSIADFEIIKPISRGSFGQVVLARKKVTGDVYAIKIQKKREMVRKNQDKYARNERNILALTHGCPYVVKLFYSFQSADSLYLVMEYLNGGDCFSLLRVFGSFSEEMVRLYVGETILALEYLHERGIVHRDLKPDNLLIGSDGHIKLTDFGLSALGLVDRHQEMRQKTTWQHLMCQDAGEPEPTGRVELSRECVGTPDYVAPEIFMGCSYGHAVDWWSLGCICYEFFVGWTPFCGDDLEEVIRRTLDGTIIWPEEDESELTPVSKDLIVQLLRQQPTERLGYAGAHQVKAHPFFEQINWDTISQTRAEFVPKTTNVSDTSYFDARNEVWTPDENIVESLKAEEEKDDVVDEETARRFRRFSFINHELLQSVDQQAFHVK